MHIILKLICFKLLFIQNIHFKINWYVHCTYELKHLFWKKIKNTWINLNFHVVRWTYTTCQVKYEVIFPILRLRFIEYSIHTNHNNLLHNGFRRYYIWLKGIVTSKLVWLPLSSGVLGWNTKNCSCRAGNTPCWIDFPLYAIGWAPSSPFSTFLFYLTSLVGVLKQII